MLATVDSGCGTQGTSALLPSDRVQHNDYHLAAGAAGLTQQWALAARHHRSLSGMI